jgi:hypothetical protein
MNIELFKNSSFKYYFGNAITNFIKGLDCLQEAGLGLEGWKKFNLNSNFHKGHFNTNMEKFNNNKPQFLPALKDGVSLRRGR